MARVWRSTRTGWTGSNSWWRPNPGEGLKPLAKIASGGETSRLMLALKNILARADQIPSLIFDEIDQGIGGRVGLVVGFKLWHLARNHQVFCVTHLPQLAAFGDEHYQVQKLIDKNRTLTRVERLDGEPQLLELSQMLGEVGEGTHPLGARADAGGAEDDQRGQGLKPRAALDSVALRQTPSSKEQTRIECEGRRDGAALRIGVAVGTGTSAP